MWNMRKIDLVLTKFKDFYVLLCFSPTQLTIITVNVRLSCGRKKREKENVKILPNLPAL